MHETYMRQALELAREAATHDEVPVGAVVVRHGEVIATGQNRKERDNCAVRHAEIEAIEQAAKVCGNWYLDDCDLYVTLEPCVMCTGAIILSRLHAVYFGAYDPKSGAMGSVYDLVGDKKLNHRMTVQGGVLAAECGGLLSDFFAAKRRAKKGCDCAACCDKEQDE